MPVEVLGLGCTAIDELLYLERHPGLDGKERVQRRERAFGGLVGTALVAAARLGAACAYAGRLGPDDSCRLVEANFLAHGVAVDLAPRSEEARVVRSTILVSSQPPGRSILFQAEGAIGPDPAAPSAAVIAGAKVLLLDHYGVAGGVRAARLARQHGVAVIADIEGAWDEVGELIAEVDHLLLSQEAAQQLSSRYGASGSGAGRPEALVDALWSPARSVVAVTDGERGCWWRERSGGVQHLPAFSVSALDTTGCGDVFHGAYAVGIVRGWDTGTRLRFASAAAALKATRLGGQAACPNAAEVDAFLSRHASHPDRSHTRHAQHR